MQATLAAAHAGDQVWVKTGTYAGNFTATDGVAVYGGFAGTETNISQRSIAASPTILDGNQSGPVYAIPSAATHTNTLDGFTVQNGQNGSASGAAADGGGISDTSSGNLVIANCTFTGKQRKRQLRREFQQLSGERRRGLRRGIGHDHKLHIHGQRRVRRGRQQ